MVKFLKVGFQNLGFCYKLYVQVNSWFLKYNWTILNALEHASCVYSVHALDRVIFSIVVFSLTLSDVVRPWFSFFGFFSVYPFQPLASWLGRLEPIAKPPPPLLQPLTVIGFKLRKKETYKKLNIFRSVWAERKVVLDELDPKIRRNFKRRGWLPLLDIDHPPLATLIREFYLNLSIHSSDSNTQFVKSWIRGKEYVITLLVMASALGVPKV